MSITHLLILLSVVILIFGTGKLRTIGSDIGSTIRDFRTGVEGQASLHKPVDEPTTTKLTSDNAEAESIARHSTDPTMHNTH